MGDLAGGPRTGAQGWTRQSAISSSDIDMPMPTCLTLLTFFLRLPLALMDPILSFTSVKPVKLVPTSGCAFLDRIMCDGSIYSVFKKEYAEAKKNGNVDEKTANPINASLFTLILQWALEEMNIFV
jgi:hypothetical protein